jgi:hypothetical protein
MTWETQKQKKHCQNLTSLYRKEVKAPERLVVVNGVRTSVFANFSGYTFWSCLTEKRDLSPSEEWGVDQQLISKLKEQYKRERQKGKKGQAQRPKRSTLQTMLANLGGEDEIHDNQDEHQDNNNIPDIDADDGERLF